MLDVSQAMRRCCLAVLSTLSTPVFADDLSTAPLTTWISLSAVLALLLAATLLYLRHQGQRLGDLQTNHDALIEQSLAGIYIVQNEIVVYCTPRAADMLGYTQDEMTGLPTSALLDAEERERVRLQLQRRRRDQIIDMRFQLRLRHRNGRRIDTEVHSRLAPYRGADATIGIMIDVSDRTEAEHKQRLSDIVFDNAAEGILLTDGDARIIAVNRAFTRITGYEADEVVNRRSRLFRVDHMGRAINRQMLQSLDEQGCWQGEFLDRHRNGRLYPVRLSISTVHDPEGELINNVCVFNDISQHKDAEDRLVFLATHDPLTRLTNRAEFLTRLQTTCEGTSATAFALLFIDLDRFKLVNDGFGHSGGDDLLRVIAARLNYAVGKDALLSRVGGDEFTVLTNTGDRAKLALQVEHLLDELAQPSVLDGKELTVTGSIGIAVYPEDGHNAQTLLRHAEVAMYRAKTAGKNTYAFFNASMVSQASERLTMENALRNAITRQQLELHYQPQVDPDSGLIVAVEALARWHHPEWGMIPPSRFIPLAEETGLVLVLGHWVIRAACEQIARWDAAGIRVPRVAVNLSARQFADSSLCQVLTDALTSAGIAPQRIELEVTESALIEQPDAAVALLNELKALGVHLALDDFGTGYSSLSQLKNLPLDALKIDRTFIDGVPNDPNDVAITEAIVAMARKLALTVVAEGAETIEQRDFLAACGCDLIQGFYYSRPLPPEALAAYIRSGTSRHSATRMDL